MMKPLRIKDNSSNLKECFADIPALTEKISDKTLEQLENEGVFVFPELVRDADDLTKDQLILQSVNDTYRNVTPRNDIFLMKHGLMIPDAAADFDDFREKMKKSEDVFISVLSCLGNS